MKFFVQDLVYYRVQPRMNNTYDYDKVKSTLGYQGIVYQVAFEWAKFNWSQVIVPVVHKKGDWPTESIHFAPELKRFINWSDSQPYTNIYSLTYQFIHNWYLPYPYRTKCINYDQEYHTPFCSTNCTKAQLIMRCKVNRTLEYLGKVPFTDIIRESEPIDMNHTLLHNRQLYHRNVSKIYNEIEKLCHEKYNRLACTDRVYRTSKIAEEIFDKSNIFRVYLPMNSNIFIQYEPMLDLLEYFTYMMSCLGIWTGLSVLDLNVFKLITDHFGHNDHAAARNRMFTNVDVWQLVSYDLRLKVVERHLVRVYQMIGR